MFFSFKREADFIKVKSLLLPRIEHAARGVLLCESTSVNHEPRRLYTYNIGVYIIETFYNYSVTILYTSKL